MCGPDCDEADNGTLTTNAGEPVPEAEITGVGR